MVAMRYHCCLSATHAAVTCFAHVRNSMTPQRHRNTWVLHMGHAAAVPCCLSHGVTHAL